jgi:LysM repeat protein
VAYGCCHLSLDPSWKDDPIVLVPAIEGIRLCRDEGCQELPVREALWHLGAIDRLPFSRIRAFVAEARLTSLLLHETKDHVVVEIVRQAIENRSLVALQEGGGKSTLTSETDKRRQLVRQIERLTRGRLSFSGRLFKLVADVDLGNVPNRNGYNVVGRDEAVQVLGGVAKQSGTASELAPLLGQACENLTPDWRPPFSQPDGLVLLYRRGTMGPTGPGEEPVISPSQLLKMKNTSWITVVVKDQADAPWQGTLRLRLPDGSDRDIPVDDQGTVHVDGIPQGDVQIKPVLPDATTHVVVQGESMSSIAAQYGWSDWKPLHDHAENANLKKLRPNPNILSPGDKVVIPPPKNEWISRPTGKSHTLVIQCPQTRFRLRLHDTEGKALAGTKYCLEFGTVKRDGKTTSEGFVDEPIPVTTQSGVLTFWPSSPTGPACVIPLQFGHLDPASETTGVQARLANLGFFAGAIDGSESPELSAAIEQFQEVHGLTVNGLADDATVAKLNERHDGG